MDMVSNLLIEVYSTMAQQELEKRAKRQAEGIIEAQKKRVCSLGERLSMSMKFSSIQFISSGNPMR